MNEKKKKLDFSVIIPVIEINDYVRETCRKLADLQFDNFEIIIFTDQAQTTDASNEKKLKAKIIITGKVGPAVKRDLALKYASGKYLAFLDDDSYPGKKWFELAMVGIKNDEVGAIGGPQLTPPADSFWQKVSGAVFLSLLSGNALIRYWPGKKIQEVDDWPTVNFIIKKKVFAEIGGFDSKYWPGEDTKLCLDIIKLGKKILYIPKLVVYHHRRKGLGKHLKQIGNYGLHRGFFAKILPETSRKFMYFIPACFVIFLGLGGLVSLFSEISLKLFLLGLGVYFLAIAISTALIWQKTKNLLISLMTIPYLVATHVWYGIRFIQGFVFTRELKSKLGK